MDGAKARSSAQERVLFSRRLRSDIVSGRYSPNERLVEADLAEKYNVRRGVVRVVLAELVHEGLAVRTVNRGARVRYVSPAEAIEITEARLAMEAICAARAAERATDEQLAEMVSALDMMSRAAAQTDIRGVAQGLHEVHDRVRRFSGHSVGQAMAERLRNQTIRHQYDEILASGRLQASVGEHKEIVDAIVARDPERAEEAVRRHRVATVAALKGLAEADRSADGDGAPADQVASRREAEGESKRVVRQKSKPPRQRLQPAGGR